MSLRMAGSRVMVLISNRLQNFDFFLVCSSVEAKQALGPSNVSQYGELKRWLWAPSRSESPVSWEVGNIPSLPIEQRSPTGGLGPVVVREDRGVGDGQSRGSISELEELGGRNTLYLSWWLIR